MTSYVRFIDSSAETYAYCLLKNHFHFLVRIKDSTAALESSAPIKSATQQFSNFFNSYAKAINKQYQRTGSLFQHRFGRIEVTSARYFANLAHYIHFNPQKHGLVDDFRAYPYSSYNVLLTDKPTRLQREHVLNWFDGQELFKTFHSNPVNERVIRDLIGDDWD